MLVHYRKYCMRAWPWGKYSSQLHLVLH